LYVDSSKLGSQFQDEDLELFHAFANQSAMAIENVRLYERMLEADKKRASLGRFLSPSVVEVIMNDGSQLELGGQTRVVTTMFCDIRSFTPMAERMRPTDLIELLNEHFTAMTEIIFQHNGTLDKYSGDEVMALFGAPILGESDATHAVQAAVKMQVKNAELNVQRKSNGMPTFETGIGINTGEVIAGYIGSPERMDFTVLGDHVNVAARLCSVAKGGRVLVGEPTYDIVKDGVEARSIGTSVLKGKADSVYAYEVLSIKP
jgi:adenylate cyclase